MPSRHSTVERSGPLFQLSHLGFSFPGATAALFKNLSLSIAFGETFVILGPSGEGKSTLLKMMTGLLTPDRGTVLFRGADLLQAAPRARALLLRGMGMTFQKGGLFDSLTCGDNLRFPLREVSGLPPAEIENRVRRALEEVELPGIEDLSLHEISGGMQKRLGIARSLILSPEVGLFDEPTAGLDPITSRAILKLILEMKRKYGMTVVVVTSDVRQAYQIADRIGFLYQGDLVRVGSPEAIRKSDHPVVEQFVHGLLEGPLTQDGSHGDRV